MDAAVCLEHVDHRLRVITLTEVLFAEMDLHLDTAAAERIGIEACE